MVRHFKAFNLDPTKRFVSIFNKIVNKYAPLRSATRKEKRRFNKPWLTNGILNSIKYKHRLYAKFIKTKTPESLVQFKKFRNKLNHIILIAKKDYCKVKLMQAQNRSKTQWDIINELIGKNRKRKNV